MIIIQRERVQYQYTKAHTKNKHKEQTDIGYNTTHKDTFKHKESELYKDIYGNIYRQLAYTYREPT